MKYKLYTTSQKAWDGMMEEISKAKKSIYIEMFIFLDDTKNTHDFIGTLKKKAQEGKEVVIIIDAYGSYDLERKVVNSLKESGIELLYFKSIFKRTHRKIVIVDEKVAFLGGVNIKNKIRNWHDLQIKLHGKIIIPILKSFTHSYIKCGGKNENILKYNKNTTVKKIKSWIIDNWNKDSKKYQLNNYYKRKIKRAKKSIKIVSPYFIPPRWLIKLFIKAVNRKVKIDIIIPIDTDVKILNRINYLNACRLKSLGVNFYFTKEMNHAKLLLIDDQEGLIGSQNIDFLSFKYNVEAGVFFTQKKLVNDLFNLIEKWKKKSIELNFEKRKLFFWDRISILFLKLIYPIF